jgi:hypothetical protein
VRKNESAILAYSNNGIFEITADSITQLNDADVYYLQELNENYYGINDAEQVLVMNDSLQLTDTIDLSGPNINGIVNNIALVDSQFYIITRQTNQQDHLLRLNTAFNIELDWLLPESDHYNIIDFEILNENIVLGGFNKHFTFQNARNLVKSIPLSSTENLFEEDIQVTIFEMTDYGFYPTTACPPPCYSCYFDGLITVTNNTSHPVDSFTIHYQPQSIWYGFCAGIYYTNQITLNIQPFQSVTFPLEYSYFHSYMGNSNYGQIIDLTICFSSMGPNNHIDDVPENDSFCGTYPVLFTDISEIDNHEMLIYPNPSSQYFYVDITAVNLAGQCHFEIIDLQGKVVKQFAHKLADISYMLDLKELPAGLYLLQLIANGVVLRSEKIMKE